MCVYCFSAILKYNRLVAVYIFSLLQGIEICLKSIKLKNKIKKQQQKTLLTSVYTSILLFAMGLSSILLGVAIVP